MRRARGEGERRRDGEGKKSRRIPRVCGNRTSPKTLAPSFSAFFLSPPFRLLASHENLYQMREGRRRGITWSGHRRISSGRTTRGERKRVTERESVRVCMCEKEEEREYSARALWCVRSPGETRHGTHAYTRRWELGEHACDGRVCAYCTYMCNMLAERFNQDTGLGGDASASGGSNDSRVVVMLVVVAAARPLGCRR